MNKLNYYLLKKINISNPLEEEFMDKIYKKYEEGSKIFGYEKKLSKETIKKIMTSTYEVMELRITEKEFELIAYNYIIQLMADARDGHNVDTDWAIDHIWYLRYGRVEKELVKQYKDCIPFIQDKLIKDFSKEETVKQYIKRKLYTGYLSK